MKEITITLEPAIDEEKDRSPERQKLIANFTEELKDKGVEIHPGWIIQKAAGGDSWMVGELFVKALPTVAPLVTALAGYLVARVGRKVRVKIGANEIEAGSVEEIERLVRFIDEHNRTKTD